MSEKSDFEKVRSMFEDSPQSQLRLETMKRQLALHENEAQWVYIAIMENYQRLYEDVPRLINEAAKAECESLREELRIITVASKIGMNDTATKAATKVNAAAKDAESVAESAVEKAAGDLVQKVSTQINSTIATQATAALWRQKATTLTFALFMVSCTSISGYLLSPFVVDPVIAHIKAEPIRTLLTIIWHFPAGWVITLTAFSALVAFAVEIGGAQFKEWLKNRFNNRGY